MIRCSVDKWFDLITNYEKDLYNLLWVLYANKISSTFNDHHKQLSILMWIDSNKYLMSFYQIKFSINTRLDMI